MNKYKIAVDLGYKYNPETGDVIGQSGKIITKIDTNGYMTFSFNFNNKKHLIYNHRFGWYCSFNDNPDYHKECIDHINRIKTDNRIINLRKITRTGNGLNTNASGCYFDKNQKKWQSVLRVKGKKIFLGYYDTREEASNLYKEEKIKYIK